MEKIHVTNLSPRKIIENFIETGPQEAFYVCELDDVIYKFDNWKKLMPRVEPHYAVKCNSTRSVLEILAGLGMGFDCASMEEIRTIRSLGVDPNRIIFANPTKLSSHIRYAKSEGVSTMTFDCETELEKMKQLYPEVRAVLRIRYDDPEAHYKLGEKFGCDPQREAPKLLKYAKKLGVNVIGISFHIGSPSNDHGNNPLIYREAIKAAKDVFEAGKNLGIDLNLLDIGGGYVGKKGSSIADTAEVINQALDEFFPPRANLKIISEPGRFFVSSAFTLLVNVITVKTNNHGNDDGKPFDYYIDDGVFGSFIDVLHNEQFIGQPLKSIEMDVPLYPCTIWGPTCNSFDKLQTAMLPAMKVGDWLIFENMGAYTLSLSTHFNGFTAPGVQSIITEKSWKITESIIDLNNFIINKIKNDFKSQTNDSRSTQVLNGHH